MNQLLSGPPVAKIEKIDVCIGSDGGATRDFESLLDVSEIGARLD